ncbi:MAG TPA: peptide chain release factor N(5)-glutamine methyltransferase [Candidatus Dormibacteraeota bacterium]|nr:peptide chain release factor N(5)-glutamine methyltransferase [Candidatus Dormibacteraeota bacterium]
MPAWAAERFDGGGPAGRRSSLPERPGDPPDRRGKTAPQARLTLLEVLRRATDHLGRHGSTSPRLDAEVLLAHVLGLRRLDLYLQHDRPLGEAELAPYRDLIARRARGAPVAYLVGRREFMKLEFEVTPAVLVPNPDTEVLVERAVSWARERGRPVRVADVGTGSGCIAIAVAHYLPGATVWATDDDPAALAVAERNVRAHGLEDRVRLARGDLVDPLPDGLDLICANLPYVAEGTALPPEVLAQPARALFAGDGGAALVNRLLARAPARLAAGGAVLVEIDPSLRDRLHLQPYVGHRFHRDLAGRTRVLEAWIG